jgi:citrate synthase
MKGPELLESNAGVLRTRVGACWPGSRAVFRGHDLHKDLHGIDWMELFVFGITGRRFTSQQVKLLHAIWTVTCYPDTRLWNNRVGALAGNARSSSVLGLSAAIAITEAGMFGGGPGIRAIDFFLRTGHAVKAGADLDEWVGKELESRWILGYGRPLNSTDERLPSLNAHVKELGFDQGEHYRLAFAIEKILVARKPFLKMNYAALTAALAADLGFSPREYQMFNILKSLGGMPPCIVEAAEKPEGTLFPTACEAIVYEGQAARPWPK